jgi:threonine/homoserine/homoserine lactone efflux protein
MIFPDWSQLSLFLGATLLVSLTPGPDVLYIASASLTRSRIHGVLAVLGISAGLIVHIILVAVGVGEIMRYSPIAFWALKICGALYLAYLAWTSFRGERLSLTLSKKSNGSLLKTFLGGFLTNLLNPKVIFFFLTFLPQFVDVGKGHFMSQLITLGGLFIVIGTLIDLMYAFFFGVLKNLLLTSEKINKAFQRVTGLLFASLAYKLLLAESR